jgi:hypothetical protein
MFDPKKNQHLVEQVRQHLDKKKSNNPENPVFIEDISDDLGIPVETVESIIKIFIDNLFDKKNPEPRTPKEIQEELNIVLEDIHGILDGENTHHFYCWIIIDYPTMGVIPNKTATIPS